MKLCRFNDCEFLQPSQPHVQCGWVVSYSLHNNKASCKEVSVLQTHKHTFQVSPLGAGIYSTVPKENFFGSEFAAKEVIYKWNQKNNSDGNSY